MFAYRLMMSSTCTEMDIGVFLSELHPGMEKATPELLKLGVSNTSFLKFLSSEDVEQLPDLSVIQKRVLMAEVNKRQTPNSKQAILVMNKDNSGTSTTKKTLHFEDDQQEEIPAPDQYDYLSPIEAAISAVEVEVTEKKVELESARDYYKKLQALYPVPTGHRNKQQCSKCHIRGDHNRRNCQVLNLY